MARNTEPKETPASKKSGRAKSPEVIVEQTTGVVLVANQHTGGIVFPRKGEGGVIMKPLRLAPGTTTQIDAEEWTKYKSNRLVQHYLDAGLIAEVRRVQNVPILTETSSDLQVPENLKTEAELGGAKVTKENVGEVTLD